MSEKETKDNSPPPGCVEAVQAEPTTQGDALAGEGKVSEAGLDLGNVGNKLRELYGTWQEEPIPERFTKLLEQLNETPPKKPDGS